LKVIVHARQNPEKWAETVNDMIQRGAPVFPDEIEALTSFLAKSFGASVPRLVNVNTVRLEDLEKLPGLSSEIAGQIVEVRSKSGAFRDSESLRRALGMEKADFDKMQYWFKYSD
jgi:DNA uptake protein ComE-like DNA-binding protein